MQIFKKFILLFILFLIVEFFFSVASVSACNEIYGQVAMQGALGGSSVSMIGRKNSRSQECADRERVLGEMIQRKAQETKRSTPTHALQVLRYPPPPRPNLTLSRPSTGPFLTNRAKPRKQLTSHRETVTNKIESSFGVMVNALNQDSDFFIPETFTQEEIDDETYAWSQVFDLDATFDPEIYKKYYILKDGSSVKKSLEILEELIKLSTDEETKKQIIQEFDLSPLADVGMEFFVNSESTVEENYSTENTYEAQQQTQEDSNKLRSLGYEYLSNASTLADSVLVTPPSGSGVFLSNEVLSAQINAIKEKGYSRAFLTNDNETIASRPILSFLLNVSKFGHAEFEKMWQEYKQTSPDLIKGLTFLEFRSFKEYLQKSPEQAKKFEETFLENRELIFQICEKPLRPKERPPIEKEKVNFLRTLPFEDLMEKKPFLAIARARILQKGILYESALDQFPRLETILEKSVKASQSLSKLGYETLKNYKPNPNNKGHRGFVSVVYGMLSPTANPDLLQLKVEKETLKIVKDFCLANPDFQVIFQDEEIWDQLDAFSKQCLQPMLFVETKE